MAKATARPMVILSQGDIGHRSSGDGHPPRLRAGSRSRSGGRPRTGFEVVRRALVGRSRDSGADGPPRSPGTGSRRESPRSSGGSGRVADVRATYHGGPGSIEKSFDSPVVRAVQDPVAARPIERRRGSPGRDEGANHECWSPPTSRRVGPGPGRLARWALVGAMSAAITSPAEAGMGFYRIFRTEYFHQTSDAAPAWSRVTASNSISSTGRRRIGPRAGSSSGGKCSRSPPTRPASPVISGDSRPWPAWTRPSRTALRIS